MHGLFSGSFLGGQFSPARGGQFGPARPGQFKPAEGGQFHRRLHFIERNTYLLDMEEYEHNTRDAFFQYVSNPIKQPALDGARITTGNLVGFVAKSVNNELFQMQISSRFGNQFLISLIADTDGFLELQDYGDIGKENWAEWLLIFLWKIKLKTAYRLGLPKEYVSASAKLHRVRGSLDVNSLLVNQEFYPPFDCSYREHSYDNDVTRLINRTFHSISNKSLVADCNRIHHDFLIATKDKRPTIQRLLKTERLKNPYYAAYNDVARLSKMLLKRQAADVRGANNDFSAFLFDISMLFEHFIRKTLIRNDWILEEKNLAHHRISNGNDRTRGLMPDVIIRDRVTNELEVFDVKYKHFSFKEGVKREDLFQLHTYLGYFLHTNEVKRCGFIYPISQQRLAGRPSVIKNTIFQAGREIPFEIHFFVVPSEDSLMDGDLKYQDVFKLAVEQFLLTFKTQSCKTSAK